MPIHLNGVGRLETELMEDMQLFGDQPLEFGHDALSLTFWYLKPAKMTAVVTAAETCSKF